MNERMNIFPDGRIYVASNLLLSYFNPENILIDCSMLITFGNLCFFLIKNIKVNYTIRTSSSSPICRQHRKMDIDQVEDELGGLSCYQIFSIFSCTLFVTGFAMSPQTGVIYYSVPDHRCALPYFDDHAANDRKEVNNFTVLAIPSGDSCYRYAYNSTACGKIGDFSCLVNSSEERIIPCDAGYHYDTTYFENTVVSEWNLVCSRQIWIGIINSIYFAGILVGCPPVGYMVDWYGRKFSMSVLALSMLGSGIGCSFSPNLVVYCVFRFCEGVASVPSFVAVFSYINELTSRKSRAPLVAYIMTVSGVLHTIFPVVAFFIRDWRDLNLCLALLPVAFLTTAYFIPETPRWLLIKGRTTEAKRVLKRIAQSKGKIINEDDWDLMVEKERKKQNIGSSRSHISDLFRRPFIRIVTLIVIFDWFSSNCIYYGLILGVGTLFGNPYLNAILNGAMEIVAAAMYVIVSKRKGQRFVYIFGSSVSGLCCIVAVIAGEIQNSAPFVVRWSSIIGKLFATLAQYSVYQYTSELFPTVTRGKAIATASMSARIGNIVVPFLLFTQSKSGWIVKTILSILAISSASFTLLLPNTSSLVITATLQEAENYYRSNMAWLVRFLQKDRRKDEESEGGKGMNVSEANEDETKL